MSENSFRIPRTSKRVKMGACMSSVLILIVLLGQSSAFFQFQPEISGAKEDEVSAEETKVQSEDLPDAMARRQSRLEGEIS